MNKSLVVTLIGPDRPGMVNAVSERALAHGANWAESLMANLAGQFAGIVHLQVDADEIEALSAELRALAAPGMQVVVAVAGGPKPAPTRRMALCLVGHDRPGIIQTISAELTRQGVSIATLTTAIVSGAMSGEQLFEMNAEIDVPEGVALGDIRRGLEGLANDLMVDLEFGRKSA
ncbi:MAG: glycine cleavage system protein R [Betaproteobacteria bacterium]|nr:glycine cleavage system protein R [Betaproteobacteria bacterium]